MPIRERERIQFISFASMKRNFTAIFGRAHDGFAELLFRYLSDIRSPPRNTLLARNKSASEVGEQGPDVTYPQDDLNKARVNFLKFLQKLKVFWPKKSNPNKYKGTDPSTAARAE